MQKKFYIAVLSCFVVMYISTIPCEPDIINLIAGSPFSIPPEGGPADAVFSPDGKLLAICNLSSDDVTVFQVGSDGTLAQVSDLPFPTGGNNPLGVAFNPDGKLLAVSNNISEDVTVFDVASNGTLTMVGIFSVFPGGGSPTSLSFSPDGELLAILNLTTSAVTLFHVASNGTLVQVSDSPFPTGGNNPSGLSFSPDGKLLAIVNFLSPGVGTMFHVASDGTLTEATGSPFSTGGALPADVTFNPDGKLLAVINDLKETVSIFQVKSNGTLISIPGSPFNAVLSSASDSAFVKFSPDGKLLAIDGPESDIQIFQVSQNGRLTLIGLFATEGSVRIAKFSPGGNFLAAVSREENSVSMFCVNNNRNSFVEALFTKYQPICPIQ